MLYQKGTQRIEVIVRKEGGSADTNSKEKSTDEVGGNEGEKTWRTSLFGSNKPERRKRVIKTNLTHSLAVTQQIAQLGFQYWVGGIGYQNGDQALQDNISRNIEIYKDATGAASSVGMGILYGSWGGPIGAALGGLFGAISSGASLAVKYGSRKRDYDYKVFKENNAIEYQRARANINLTTGRLR